MSYNIINAEEFDYSWFSSLPDVKRTKGNPKRRKENDFKYVDIITAFDIETTGIDELEHSIMYIWQWQFGDKCTVIGRTWEDFLHFQECLKLCLGENRRLCVFVHNLSYEFIFLSGIYHFKSDDVFCVKSRKILKCVMDEVFEFRCSYMLTNMSLGKFTESMNIEHKKLKDFDYNKKRYAWTPLTEDEMTYCVNDVQGLVEAITLKMIKDDDNFYSIPLTSTGYVRREVRRAMSKYPRKMILRMLPPLELVFKLMEAFRGGNTHASRFQADVIIKNVKSKDIASSYPYQLMKMYPLGVWGRVINPTIEDVVKRLKAGKKAMLIEFRAVNVRLHDEYEPVPYLASDKCRVCYQAVKDNGRVIKATCIETIMTDIDFRIFSKIYDFDDIEIISLWTSTYGILPKEYRDEVIKFYKNKTELKGVEEKEYFYSKSKALLNALYGMAAQKVLHPNVLYIDGNFVEDPDYNPVEDLDKAYKNPFSSYAWGVWCTAHARKQLQDAIDIVGDSFIYCDTDSVKFDSLNDFEEAFNKLNEENAAYARKMGLTAFDINGIEHPAGVFEDDGDYAEFVTLGAKKYAYTTEEGGPTHITLAGVNKKLGAIELDKYGGLNAFQEGFVFREAGGTEAIYNDLLDDDFYYTIEGHTVRITSNLYLYQGEYTLGLTDEYRNLINNNFFYLFD